MRIKKHEKSYIVGLEDGSSWRIWPGDLATPLLWMPSTRLAVSEINGECWTHVLTDRLHGTCVRVIEAAAEWAPEKIEASLIYPDSARIRRPPLPNGAIRILPNG
jgi:hypothetical protein